MSDTLGGLVGEILISERVKSGLENCKRKGIRLGRPSNLTLEKENEIKTLYSDKMGLNKISKEVNVGVRLIKKVLKSCIVEQV